MRRFRLDATDRLALAAIGAWLGWVVVATALNGRPLPLGSPYLLAPLVAVVGVAAGRLLAAKARSWPLPEIVLAVAAFFLVAWTFDSAPGKLPLRYANANAAVGVQLAALAALVALARPAGHHEPDRIPPEHRARYARNARRVLLAAGAMAAAVVAINKSAAGLAVLLPVVAVGLWAAKTGRGPRRAISVGLGAAVVAAAAGAVVSLAAADTWPGLLVRALDAARKTLWADALAVWRQHPLIGGGPGAFREASALAADPDTATVHSSVLQVGSELGAVGVVLFGAVLLVGFLIAARGGRPATFVAASAWAALAVHSMADHLYEFPAVTFTAALVLGFAGRSGTSDEEPGG